MRTMTATGTLSQIAYELATDPKATPAAAQAAATSAARAYAARLAGTPWTLVADGRGGWAGSASHGRFPS
jgi:hypothetical protein